MSIETTSVTEPEVTCATCHTCCCRLEVMLITDTGVPTRHIKTDKWGGEVMHRLEDGWCSALNRDNLMCTIYAPPLDLPRIRNELLRMHHRTQ